VVPSPLARHAVADGDGEVKVLELVGKYKHVGPNCTCQVGGDRLAF
jgi:hypothetical protein